MTSYKRAIRPMSSDLIAKSAVQIVNMLKSGEVSPHELLDALEQRVGEVDGVVNALPTLCFARARANADTLMKLPVGERGLLAGLPVPIKDLSNVKGVRTTLGSLMFKDNVPDTSDILVEHLERQGGLIFAKSNTPEFGAGANTFNEVFGPTLNPWDTSKSAAGSSGGAAVALATGMAWLAQGSDMGGSLRNPASFCGVVGMRPSPGRIARSQGSDIFAMLGVEGPMARNVEDLALLFDAMVGQEIKDPVSLPFDGNSFLKAARSGQKPKRVAFSMDLGITHVDSQVRAVLEQAIETLANNGIIIEQAHPDLNEVHKVFDTLRALAFATGLGPFLKDHGDKLKPEVVWNIEKGLALSVEEIVHAKQLQATMFERMCRFFETYDLLLAPSTIVPPFPIEERYVESCDGHVFENYYQWLAIAYAITNVACPALSLPAGFTPSGLPVGLQIIGPPRGEAQILSSAKLFEDILGYCQLTPIDPRIRI